MHLLGLDAKRGLAVEGKLVLLVDSEASHAGALGSGTGVRHGEGDGLVGVLDDIQVLPAGGSLVLSVVGDPGVLRAATDYADSECYYHPISRQNNSRHLRTRISFFLVSPPTMALAK